MEEHINVSEHVVKISGYINRLNALECKISDELAVYRVLQSLPPRYKGFFFTESCEVTTRHHNFIKKEKAPLYKLFTKRNTYNKKAKEGYQAKLKTYLTICLLVYVLEGSCHVRIAFSTCQKRGALPGKLAHFSTSKYSSKP
jgi:hypothetical protein